MTIRVLIADDQELVRTGFGLIIKPQEDIELVGEAGDGQEAVELAAKLRPDVILMPRLDGLEATRRLLANPARLPRAPPKPLACARAHEKIEGGRIETLIEAVVPAHGGGGRRGGHVPPRLVPLPEPPAIIRRGRR